MIVLMVVETAVLAVLCILVAGLLRSYADVLRRLHALDGGPSAAAAQPEALPTREGIVPLRPMGIESREEWTAAHDLRGTSLSGEIVAIPVAGVRHDTVLAFLSSGCAGCQGFWADLARPGGYQPAPGARLVVVAKDEQDESITELQRLASPDVDVVMSSAAWEAYEVPESDLT